MSPKSKVRTQKQRALLPFVFSNFAMTADGKIAFGGRDFVPFGSKHDREHMMELRATADAVICGVRTVETTETILGTGGEKFRKRRLKNGLSEFPLRVVASGSGSIDPNANLFKKRFSPIIILTTARISKANLQKLRAVADEVKICGETKIDFCPALRWLRKKWNVRRLLCEGGGELNGALLHAGLVDELHLTICPKIFGGRTAPTIADGKGFERLADAAKFRLKSARLVAGELFTVFSR
jgi:2,5-diamino-6-(ribosylamino)-4(3H)-pyrimidinone 5'-phosphate reductase